MFYDTFRHLCSLKGISCNKAASEIGLSNATPTKWKKTGATPTVETLQLIADYFSVPVSYFLNDSKDSKSDDKHDILDDIDVAFYGDYKQLSEDDKEMLRAMARTMLDRRKKRGD